MSSTESIAETTAIETTISQPSFGNGDEKQTLPFKDYEAACRWVLIFNTI